MKSEVNQTTKWHGSFSTGEVGTQNNENEEDRIIYAAEATTQDVVQPEDIYKSQNTNQ